MAERQGFEPWRRLPAYTLSRRAPSTTRPPLLILHTGLPRVGRREAHASLKGSGWQCQPVGAFDHLPKSLQYTNPVMKFKSNLSLCGFFDPVNIAIFAEKTYLMTNGVF